MQLSSVTTFGYGTYIKDIVVSIIYKIKKGLIEQIRYILTFKCTLFSNKTDQLMTEIYMINMSMLSRQCS